MNLPFPKKQWQIDFAGKKLTLEVSRLAEQANAAVLGRYGETAVLATAVMANEDRDIDYLPLTVEYEEKHYAGGKIMGGRFLRREARPSEHAILSGRLIDRTIRPLFDHRLRRDIQIVITVLSWDEEADPNFLGLLTASTALTISDIPWAGPAAGIEIAKFQNGQTVINPGNGQLQEGFEFQIFAAGAGDKINMIELEGVDAQEKEVVAAIAGAQAEIKKLIEWQKVIGKDAGRPKTTIAFTELDPELKNKVTQLAKDKLESALYVKEKNERQNRVNQLKEELKRILLRDGEKNLGDALQILEEEIDRLVHKNILEAEKRPDLRRLDEVRPLYAETGLFNRLHGSALFVRGNTQALAITTLGPPDNEQLVETLEFSGKKSFLMHYNFPPFSTGETGRLGAPGRREIGHGALAEKALRHLLPVKDQFPYTIRLVSEILSSNGSSSMASVCAGCLSLMDAGVPIKKMAAGIAMGLMSDDQGNYKVLTDIQGPEDHYGDMDLKAAGTKDGLTALQMDVKIKGISPEQLTATLEQAKKARLQILDFMSGVLPEPKKSISSYAPTVLLISINPQKIGEVIGPGGKIINSIIAQTGAAGIDIEQDGQVYIYGQTKEAAEAAKKQVEAIVKEYRVGDIVEGTIVKILDFGAIVEFGHGRDGMIHVSELKNGYVEKVTDVVKTGDFVKAKIIRAEPNGKIGLSLKNL